jgi:hypothetical protein
LRSTTFGIETLAETRTGRDVSVFQHELEGNDPFALQDQLAKYTEEFMWAVSQGETERADGIPLADMNAFELMLTSKGARLENNRRALALAPDFFLASTHVAQDLFFGVVMGQEEDTEAIRDEALQLARRGWQLAPLDPQASSIAAQVEMGFGDPAMAARYVNHLLELKSTSSAPLYLALIVNDRVAEGLTHAKANPLVSDLTLCHLYLAADRLPEAVRHCQMATDDNPFGYLERMAFANVLGYLDRRDDVEDILRGVGRDGALASVAAYERGARAFWGSAEFTDKLVGGLKRLGFE